MRQRVRLPRGRNRGYSERDDRVSAGPEGPIGKAIRSAASATAAGKSPRIAGLLFFLSELDRFSRDKGRPVKRGELQRRGIDLRVVEQLLSIGVLDEVRAGPVRSYKVNDDYLDSVRSFMGGAAKGTRS